MYTGKKIGVVIPCYRVARHILGVLAEIPDQVDVIVCVDDGCPEGSGKLIERECHDPRVRVLYHPANKGVGGAVKSGYAALQDAQCEIAVKIDGDGQMDPRLVAAFVQPIATGQYDYTKGNRFFRVEDVRAMPGVRFLGNALLSLAAKLSTGYWTLFDPTNGYTAIHLAVLDLVPLDKVDDRFFFETDLLFRLNIARCAVRDVPMKAVYGDQKSNLRVTRAIWPFAVGHMRNAAKRIFYTYFLRDFHVASLQLVVGPMMLLAGAIFGGSRWWLSAATDIPATAGTVVIAALLVIFGLQLCLAAISFDMGNVPDKAVHPVLTALPPSSPALVEPARGCA